MDNEGKADVDERSFLVIQTSVVCALNAIAYLHLLTRWLPDLANGLASVSVKPTPNPQAQGERLLGVVALLCGPGITCVVLESFPVEARSWMGGWAVGSSDVDLSLLI